MVINTVWVNGDCVRKPLTLNPTLSRKERELAMWGHTSFISPMVPTSFADSHGIPLIRETTTAAA